MVTFSVNFWWFYDHWFLTLAIFASLVVCGPALFYTVSAQLGYWRWRLGGGVKKAIRFANLNWNDKPQESLRYLWQAYNLRNPHPMVAKLERQCWVSKKYLKSIENHWYISLDGHAELENQACENGFPVTVTFNKVFAVKPRKIKHGCHGHYSLKKATFLKSTYGGDPICGGGIKHFWPPRFLEYLEQFRLLRVLQKEKNLHGFVCNYSNGTSGAFFEKNFADDEPMGYLEVFLGEETLIREFVKRSKRFVKPIQLKFV